ncbi:hypothetical protein ACFYUV_24680 [Nonomuraea sp. NPDC003560]
MNRLYCRRCLGSGTITAYRSQPQPTGPTLVIETTETCPTCQGRGTR